MADDFRVVGAEQFLALSKRLKAAGEFELRKELNKGLRDAAKPLIPKVRAAAQSQLPKHGGLAALVGKAPVRVQVKTGATAGVSVKAGGRKGSGVVTNRGYVRHPVFGGKTWVSQPVTAGWFDKTMQKSAPDVLPELQRAVERVANKIAEKG